MLQYSCQIYKVELVNLLKIKCIEIKYSSDPPDTTFIGYE